MLYRNDKNIFPCGGNNVTTGGVLLLPGHYQLEDQTEISREKQCVSGY